MSFHEFRRPEASSARTCGSMEPNVPGPGLLPKECSWLRRGKSIPKGSGFHHKGALRAARFPAAALDFACYQAYITSSSEKELFDAPLVISGSDLHRNRIAPVHQPL